MSGIPEATPVLLTMEERADLDRLARSTRTEHRLRQRARIVLLAADGMASRAIGRAVGCTTGTVSKWRVRYAEKRFAGLDETGDRAPSRSIRRRRTNASWRCWIKCRPRAMPAGRGRCWLPRWAMSSPAYLALPAFAEDRPCRAQILVREQRSRVRRQGCRRGRALHGAARERHRHLRRRKALDPGAGAGAGVYEASERSSADRT
jgi:hypothetical protein